MQSRSRENGTQERPFCEGGLKGALYEKGYAIVRGSLLGINDAVGPHARPAKGSVRDTRTIETVESSAAMHAVGSIL